MKFKTWFKETVMNSAGNDNQPTQTNQATDQAAKSIMADKSFAPVQAKIMNMSGSPSGQRNKLIKNVARDFKSVVPPQIAPLTSPAPVAFNIQKSLGLNLGIPKPQFMKRK